MGESQRSASAQRPALALGVVGDLVAAETSDDEVLRLRVGEVQAADRGAGPHRHALGELDADASLDVEQLPQRLLLGVVRARGVAGGGADAVVLLLDQRLVVELLVGRVAPELLAHPLVQPLGEGLGEPVGQRLEQDRGVVVELALELA